MKKKHLILLGILALLILGGGYGLLQYFKPHKDFGASAPDYTLTAKELWHAFDAGETAANARFVAGDKTVQVSGTVGDVSKNADGTLVVTLTEPGLDGSVACTLMPSESSKENAIRKGSPATLKGQCTGMQELLEKQVVMIRGVLVQ